MLPPELPPHHHGKEPPLEAPYLYGMSGSGGPGRPSDVVRELIRSGEGGNLHCPRPMCPRPTMPL